MDGIQGLSYSDVDANAPERYHVNDRLQIHA